MAGFRLKPAEKREVADFLEKLRSIQMDDDIEGDDPPEYTPPTCDVDKATKTICIVLLIGMVLLGFVGLAARLGGPIQ